MNIRPLDNRVVIERMEEERTTAGGIVIPDSASKEKPIRGEIKSVGAGKRLDNGEVRAMAVKVGDQVLFGKYSGTEVKVDGQEYMIMTEDDLLAVIEA